MANERREEPSRRAGARYDRPTGSPEYTVRGETYAAPASVRRISWGAIFAGAVIALVIQLMLNLLGLSIGLGTIDPATEQDPFSGIGVGAGIWFVLTGLIALFAGGWTAGRLAGLPRRLDGILHGFVTWALTTFVTLYLVTSGVGTVLSGAFNVVQAGAQLVGQGIEAVAPGAAQIVGDVSAEEIKNEALAILRDTGREDLQPENLAERAAQVADTAQAAAGEAAQTPSEAGEEIEGVFDQLIAQGQDVVDDVDREAAVNVLVRRTDMTEAEARQTVDEYVNVLQDARAQLRQTAESVGDQAVQTSDQVIAAISSAALWAFLAMLVGAAAASAGGAVGAPTRLPESRVVEREA